MPINSFLYPAKHVPVAYEVANSLRFDDGSSDYLSQTFSGAGNQRTFTISFWFKRSNLVSGNVYTYQGEGNEIRSEFIFFNDYLKIVFNPTGSAWSSDMIIQNNGSNILFKDVSAWYHVVLAIDTTQSTEANRIKPYVNGVLQSMSAYPSQNFDTGYNTAIEHGIGTYIHATNTFFDGYFAEFCVVDGSQLDATSFGEFDSDTNIWKPIDVSGLTFGTNGFYLDFENSSSLGADVSGNGNNFTVNNLTSIDQSTDTCTNNFATLNLEYAGLNANFSLSEGNLKGLNTGNGENNYVSTIGVSSGKWYFEAKANVAGDNYATIGIVATDSLLQVNGSWLGSTSDSYFYNENGGIGTNGSASTTGLASYTDNDIIGVRVNLDDNELHFYKNGTIITNTALSITANKEYFFGGRVYSNATGWEFNFGSPPYSISSGNSDANGYGNFEYSVPSGYYALCTKNLAEYG